jgi:hypothetical protein
VKGVEVFMAEKKVSEEQLASLKEIQAHYEFLSKRYGELHFELKAVDSAMDDLIIRKAMLVEALQAEFGATGTVDLETGIFTPE